MAEPDPVAAMETDGQALLGEDRLLSHFAYPSCPRPPSPPPSPDLNDMASLIPFPSPAVTGPPAPPSAFPVDAGPEEDLQRQADELERFLSCSTPELDVNISALEEPEDDRPPAIAIPPPPGPVEKPPHIPEPAVALVVGELVGRAEAEADLPPTGFPSSLPPAVDINSGAGCAPFLAASELTADQFGVHPSEDHDYSTEAGRTTLSIHRAFNGGVYVRLQVVPVSFTDVPPKTSPPNPAPSVASGPSRPTDAKDPNRHLHGVKRQKRQPKTDRKPPVKTAPHKPLRPEASRRVRTEAEKALRKIWELCPDLVRDLLRDFGREKLRHKELEYADYVVAKIFARRRSHTKVEQGLLEALFGDVWVAHYDAHLAQLIEEDEVLAHKKAATFHGRLRLTVRGDKDIKKTLAEAGTNKNSAEKNPHTDPDVRRRTAARNALRNALRGRSEEQWNGPENAVVLHYCWKYWRSFHSEIVAIEPVKM